jgi:hypothetical protein
MERMGFTQSAGELQAEYAETEYGLTDQQLTSLRQFEDSFMREDGGYPWWPFFESGVRDETGAVWSVYNRWFDETRPDGWKVAYCPRDGDSFSSIDVGYVIRSSLRPVYDAEGGLTTFQLHIHDDNYGMQDNDVLNLILYHNENGISEASLRMWNQSSSMEPI